MLVLIESKIPTKPKGYRLVGDVAFDEVAEKASYITPVPWWCWPYDYCNAIKEYI